MKGTYSGKSGNRCPKCNLWMQRWIHKPEFKPKPGVSYFRYWDRCFPCKNVQLYESERVRPGTVEWLSKTATQLCDEYHKCAFQAVTEWDGLSTADLFKRILELTGEDPEEISKELTSWRGIQFAPQAVESGPTTLPWDE